MDPSYRAAAECLAIVLTDIGTNTKLAGNTQEGIKKYFEALKVDPHYAVIFSYSEYFAFIFKATNFVYILVCMIYIFILHGFFSLHTTILVWSIQK